MNIKQELFRENSKENARAIANFVLQHPKSFVHLIDHLFGEDRLLAQRAAWPAGLVGEQQPAWLCPYLPKLLNSLEKPVHPAVSRNIYRALQFLNVPEEFCAPLLDLCLRDINNPKEPTAIKVNAMTVASNIASEYPEVLGELIAVIENHLPNASPGYRARARHLTAENAPAGSQKVE